MNKILNKFLNKEVINYIIFGVLTTIVNYVTYEACNLRLDYKLSTIIAWFLAVMFAFITNKLFVFESKSFEKSLIFKELTSFIASRIVSGIFDFIFMVVAVELLTINDSISKLASNIFVVVINYILSKLFVFKSTTER